MISESTNWAKSRELFGGGKNTRRYKTVYKVRAEPQTTNKSPRHLNRQSPEKSNKRIKKKEALKRKDGREDTQDLCKVSTAGVNLKEPQKESNSRAYRSKEEWKGVKRAVQSAKPPAVMDDRLKANIDKTTTGVSKCGGKRIVLGEAMRDSQQGREKIEWNNASR